MKDRILVVDDNVANSKLLSFLLRSRGYEVEVVADADSAEVAIAQTRPDLVLMDIQLPGTDGLTLTRTLREDARNADMVILAVTAYAMKGDEERALAAGCDGYVTKPIDTRSLPDLVARYLQTGREIP